jgi:hypothetical protein
MFVLYNYDTNSIHPVAIPKLPRVPTLNPPTTSKDYHNLSSTIKPIDDKKRHKRRSSNHRQHCLHCLRHYSFHADPHVNGNQINDTVTGPSIPCMNFRPYYQLGYVLSFIKNLQNLNIPHTSKYANINAVLDKATGKML